MNLKKQFIFLFLCFLPLKLNANCTHLLKLAISKSSISTSLFNKYHAKIRHLKTKKFLRKLKSVNSQTETITFNQEMIPRDLRESFNALANDLFKEEVHAKWANELYHDLLIELHLSQNRDHLTYFLLHEKISKDLIIKVLLERSVEGGFSGLEHDISILMDSLPPEDFYNHLKKGLYILDENFRNAAHGDIIHILQLDLMIYILKSNHINPLKSLDLYKWFGEGLHFIILENELDSAWSILFDMDSYFKKITSPEIITPLYLEFFKVDKSETPSILNTK